MLNIKFHLVVYETGGEYFSTRYSEKETWNLIKGNVREIFTLIGTDFDELEENAKKEAQKRGIPAVANLF